MNQRGFVTLSVLLFLPLFLTIAFAGFFQLWFINQKNKLENICHSHLLSAQEYLVDGNTALLATNAAATTLILKKKALNLVILFGTPGAKVVARQARQVVISQQKILHKTQASLIHVAAGLSRWEMAKLQIKVQEHLAEMTRFWNAPAWSLYNVQPYWTKSKVEVALKDTASTYQRADQHSEKQTLKLTWTYPLKKVLPRWLQKYVAQTTIWEGHCLTHPHEGGNRWYAKIGEAKH